MNDFGQALIPISFTMEEAMRRLENTRIRVLYVVDDKSVLLGAVSDGDIRRGILSGKDLATPVCEIMNTKPISVSKSLSQREIKKVLLKNVNVYSIPVVNVKNQVVNILFVTDYINNIKDENKQLFTNKVFILAGGFGSRLEPFTKILPKPLVPIGDTPILEMIMDRFTENGYSNFILSVLYKADMIKTYFSEEDIRVKYKSINYIKEDKPLGTIGSLKLAEEVLKETFFISNSDILVEEDMQKIMRFHHSKKAVLTVVGCVKNSVIPYGVLKTDENGYLFEIEEKPQYRHVINTGVYIAEPEVIGYIKKNERMDITDLMELLIKDKKNIAVYPVFDDQWFDIGQWEEFEKTRKRFEEG